MRLFRKFAGTQLSVPSCFPHCGVASLAQVSTLGLCPRQNESKINHKTDSRSFTSVQMLHTHTHTPSNGVFFARKRPQCRSKRSIVWSGSQRSKYSVRGTQITKCNHQLSKLFQGHVARRRGAGGGQSWSRIRRC